MIFSIGHSTRSLEELVSLLRRHGIEVLIDVRKFPRSRRNPQFDRAKLEKELEERGIEYRWLGEPLGGYRSEALKNSPNKGWDSKGFQCYADHALGEEFREGLEEILRVARKRQAAIMCAERFFWRCHRRIICDWLLAKDHRVVHILDEKTEEHRLTGFAEVVGGKVTYPPP